ncbi:MAG: helix-turn-helix transcriptional regulator [Clostridia bacterium]|nr:helix-turn-helix transcriptional regulator [Clostridia bacterium]
MDATMLGEKITALRKEKGMTQKDLAALLHVTDKAVSKWERGLNFPEITLLEPLASALNTSVVQLLSLEDASKEKMAETFAMLSAKEKRQLIKEMKNKAVIKLVIEVILLAALSCASKLFADRGIYGLAQIVTMGMTGFVGILIGSEIYAIKKLPKLG